jgi:hypothetical protein
MSSFNISVVYALLGGIGGLCLLILILCAIVCVFCWRGRSKYLGNSFQFNCIYKKGNICTLVTHGYFCFDNSYFRKAFVLLYTLRFVITIMISGRFQSLDKQRSDSSRQVSLSVMFRRRGSSLSRTRHPVPASEHIYQDIPDRGN